MIKPILRGWEIAHTETAAAAGPASKFGLGSVRVMAEALPLFPVFQLYQLDEPIEQRLLTVH